MAKKTDNTVPKTETNEQPQDKGGRSKGRKTRPLELRLPSWIGAVHPENLTPPQ